MCAVIKYDWKIMEDLKKIFKNPIFMRLGKQYKDACAPEVDL